MDATPSASNNVGFPLIDSMAELTPEALERELQAIRDLLREQYRN
jgi:hypothetical protein